MVQGILQFVAARCSKTLLHNWYSPNETPNLV